MTIPSGAKDVYVSFMVDAEVGPDGLDPTCPSYDDLTAEVERNIDKSFSSIEGYQSANVVSRRAVEQEDNLN
ncbi:Hypp9216 [Branchiostoma lanceolatum]|uniref:Hypp9216 protein n=1 Tax=Branchiostoma lanceolatum TaxID=7740 RepID=A0A8K0EIB6_BRALA|nr:Hypp9216 [Branchiostoma lanceolatum]